MVFSPAIFIYSRKILVLRRKVHEYRRPYYYLENIKNCREKLNKIISHVPLWKLPELALSQECYWTGASWAITLCCGLDLDGQ